MQKKIVKKSSKKMPETKINERLSSSEQDIRVMQKENEIQNRVFIKFEETVEKLQTLTESMHRLITIHDERIRVQGKNIESIKIDMYREIKDLEDRITKDMQSIVKRVDESENRIMERLSEMGEKEEKEEMKTVSTSEKIARITMRIESWKWFILGGVFVIGMVLGDTHLLRELFMYFTKV